MPKPAKTTKLDREAWLSRALESLVREGGAKLRIDNLVKEVGVSKGSFYWHFKNRDAFVQDILEHWHRTTTLAVPDGLKELGEQSPEQKLFSLIDMIFSQRLTRYDLAVRSWAIQEPEIQPMIRRTDVFRNNFVRKLFAEMGFDTTNADMRARLLVTYAALYGAVFDQLSRSKQLAQLTDMHAMLIKSAN
jgi:AcrR family transcriptional regulator